MPDTRLIFVEGVMGSGKSTTASFIARQLRRNGLPAEYVWEGGTDHPIRMMSHVPRPFAPWLDLTTAAYAEQSLALRRALLTSAGPSGPIAVFDGQLFHGNLTDLLLMDAPEAELRGYVRGLLEVTRDLNPALVYFYQEDVERALRSVLAERGEDWQAYQVNWKLASPYAQRNRLAGLDGLVRLYQAYRDLTDQLFADLPIPKLAIENSAFDWPTYRAKILAFLALPHHDDADTSW